MTRFKELRRIEAAIEHRNKAELQWSLDYCQMRLKIAVRKDHERYWRRVQQQVRDALETAD